MFGLKKKKEETPTETKIIYKKQYQDNLFACSYILKRINDDKRIHVMFIKKAVDEASAHGKCVYDIENTKEYKKYSISSRIILQV